MTLFFGLLGALLALFGLLFAPLRLWLRLAYPGVSEAQVRLFRWTLSSWTSAPVPWAPPSPSGGAQGGGMNPAAQLRDIEALGAMLAPLRAAPVGDLRIAAEGSSGDPAVTALLYGFAWSAVGTFLSLRGLRPALLSLSPQLQGPAALRAYGEAEIPVTPFTLLLGALRALRVMRSRAG